MVKFEEMKVELDVVDDDVVVVVGLVSHQQRDRGQKKVNLGRLTDWPSSENGLGLELVVVLGPVAAVEVLELQFGA